MMINLVRCMQVVFNVAERFWRLFEKYMIFMQRDRDNWNFFEWLYTDWSFTFLKFSKNFGGGHFVQEILIFIRAEFSLQNYALLHWYHVNLEFSKFETSWQCFITNILVNIAT